MAKDKVLWYWMPAPGVHHPLRTISTVTYDYQTEQRSYQTLGVMGMDDFGTLVPMGVA